ncbi:putative ABC transport system permease protein [Tenacibaculum sp. MAR_2009_124]|uniref:ABC transporter permease n=1 Tax=Tenacibaculum sp. MAR_2009_124 TaxID=1250059 RepID=UPI00089B2B13|nr:ABC transporter permease [Tenacibaculum sp. MAR_2009_124]SEB47822.1 putative ABC transport system permease protein [Tenacibaculum sp. MAR_2009_124]
MFQTWFKIFFRNQKKNWLNGIVNISGLTLSLGVLVLVLLYFNDEKTYNKENLEKKEIYRVVHNMSHGDIWTTSTTVEGVAYKNDIPEVIETYMSDSWYSSKLVDLGNKKYYTNKIIRGEASFFEFFPFDILKGSVDKFKETRNNVAISETLAKQYFGSVSAIGKSLSFDERTFIITTVFKIEGKHYMEPDLVIQFNDAPEGHWGNYSHGLLVKTTKGSNAEDLQEKMNQVWHVNQVLREAEQDGITAEEWQEKYGTKILLESFEDIRLKAYTEDGGPEGKGNYELIIILLSLGVLLLIISCVNFINLSIASAEQRAKEVGIKKTLGISKFSLIVQYTAEILFQGIIAFILSLVIVELVLPSFNDFMNKEIILIDEIGVIVKLFLTTIVLSLIVGYIPAFKLSRFKSSEVLKGNVARSKRGIIGRNVMLGLQFLISGFFLTASIIIYKQVNYMTEKDLGFSGEQVLMVHMNDSRLERYNKYLVAKKELIKHPNITKVTSNFFVPNGGYSNSTNTNYKEKLVNSNGNAIDFNYLDMVKIDIIKGRGLQEKFASDTIRNILVNETMAKGLGIYNDPIGKKIEVGYLSPEDNNKFNVVGMVKDYHVFGLQREIPPTFFFHWNTFNWMKQYNFYNIQLKIKPENIQETVKFVQKYWKLNIEQDYPFTHEFLDKNFQKSFNKYQKQKTLLTILTIIVILISLLGLFALATLTIQQRLKEVAIRKTLGASVQEIMFQLIKVFLKIAIYATIVLIPLSYYFMQNWLENFVYRIDMPFTPYIITPIILTLLVFSVVGIKAYLATKVNLIKYLKFE